MQLGRVRRRVGDDPDDRVGVQQVGALLADVGAELVADGLVQAGRQREAQRAQDARAVVLRPVHEDALVRGGHHGGGACELRVLGLRRREPGLDVLDQLLGLGLLAERPADDLGLPLPRDAVVRVLLGLGHHRGDLRQGLVLVLRQPRVQGEDQVRGERGDLLHLRSRAGVLQYGRKGAAAQLAGGPGADGTRVPAQPLGRADRHLAEGQHGVLVGQADRDDPLGRGRDGDAAVLVLDGHREGAAVRRGGTGIGGAGGGIGAGAGTAGGGDAAEQQYGGEYRGEPGASHRAGHQGVLRLLVRWSVRRARGVVGERWNGCPTRPPRGRHRFRPRR